MAFYICIFYQSLQEDNAALRSALIAAGIVPQVGIEAVSQDFDRACRIMSIYPTNQTSTPVVRPLASQLANRQDEGSQRPIGSGSPATPNPATRRLNASGQSSTAEARLSSVSSSAEHEQPPSPEDRDYLMAKLMQIEEDQAASPGNKGRM